MPPPATAEDSEEESSSSEEEEPPPRAAPAAPRRKKGEEELDPEQMRIDMERLALIKKKRWVLGRGWRGCGGAGSVGWGRWDGMPQRLAGGCPGTLLSVAW